MINILKSLVPKLGKLCKKSPGRHGKARIRSICAIAALGAVGLAGQPLFLNLMGNILGSLLNASQSGAAAILEIIWRWIQGASDPQTDASFLYTWAGLIFAIALPIIVILMVLQVIRSIFQAGGLTKSGLWNAVTGAGFAIVGTAVSLPIVHSLTTLMDGIAEYLSTEILQDAEETMLLNFVGIPVTLIAAPALTGGSLGLVIVIIMPILLFMLAGGLVFLSLLVRTVLIYIVVVTAPIAFAGLTWAHSKGWLGRWMRMLISLIVAKLGIVIVFGLGMSAIGAIEWSGLGGMAQGLGLLLAGTFMMFLAAFMPAVTYKFFGFVGEAPEPVVNASSLQSDTGSGAAGRASAGYAAVTRKVPFMRTG